MGLPSPDHPQTQRVVFLIDVQPLSHLPDRDVYVSAILKCAGRFLSYTPLSESLFAFRLFFSSLNPFLPTTQVERLLGSSFSRTISFDRPSDVARSLEFALESVASGTSSPSRAAFVAGSLQQLLLDYAWEDALPDVQGTDDAADSCVGFSPNLVVLFTVAPGTREFLCGYLDAEIESRDESDDWFSNKLSEVFIGVSDKFKSVGANVCWVDFDFHSQGQNGEKDGKVTGLLERGIKGLNWGFVSCDAVVLGSLIVPFGLIWPIVACPTAFSGRHRGTAELNLQIADAKGKPLNCRLCELEIVDLKFPSDHLDSSLNKRSLDPELKSCSLQVFWKRFGNTGVKIYVDEIRTKDQLAVTKSRKGKSVLLRGFSQKREDVSKKNRSEKKSSSTSSMADAVLERLRWNETEYIAGKPEWQLLLTFLYKRYSVAVVSFSDDNGCSVTGILEPFTVHTAILQILDDRRNMDGCSQEFVDGISIGSRKSGGVSGHSFSNEGSRGFKERERMDANSTTHTDLTWDTLYTSIFCNYSKAENFVVPAMDLQSLSLHGGRNMSKRLTFLKCWMKQINKPKGHYKADLSRGLKVDLEDRIEDTLLSSQHCCQSVTNFEGQHFSSSCQSVGENLIGEHIKHDSPVSSLEDSAAFLSSVCQKIDHGLCNMEVDLASLAERLVDLSIKHVRAKHVDSDTHEKSTSSNSDSQASHTPCDISVFTNVTKLLLKKPKELAAKYKRLRAPCTIEPSTSNLASDLIPEASPEIKVREHKLQVLFRMEILRRTVEIGSKDEIEDKWAKEICFLLQNIEFDLQGGIFGGATLLEFTDSTVKSRYASILGSLIHKIYTKMEFLIFDSVPSGSNDSDSNQAANHIIVPRDQISGAQYADEIKESMDNDGHISNSLHHLEEERSPGEKYKNELYEKQLKDALKNREQAQKCSFFNKRLPDLQRVWAPKHPGKVSTRSITKRDRKKRIRETADIVYETPAPATKSNPLRDRKCEREKNPRFRSVSKALFPSFEGIKVSSESGCET